MQGLVEQRFGMESLRSIEKCRELLSKNFDNFTNYTVACTYKLLSRYEMGYGRVNYSRFYLNCVKSYFDGNEPKNSFERNMKQLIRTAEIVDSHNEMGHLFVKNLPEIFEAITNLPLPDEIIKVLQQDSVNSTNYLDQMKIIEIIVNHTVQFSKEKTNSYKTEEQRKFIDNYLENFKSIFLNGLSISMLMRSGQGNELIEEAALKVTYSSETEYFPLLPIFVLPYVALASRFHLQIVKQIENGQTQQESKKNPTSVDYYEILAKDLLALRVLAKRYKRVEFSYGTMMNEMDEILKKKVEQSSQQNVEFSTTSDVATPQTTHVESSCLIDEQPLSFLLGFVNEAAQHSQPFESSNQHIAENPFHFLSEDFSQMLSPDFSFF
ncbi:predicted protein [Naegleria gruberi]|uniref:Predicted protein n=1 Tax=Naegleria gruberi TaxID=5762 RepID=D2V8D9_NAEGR|nr:uncharacterized protein NAEGRDRAFT_47494 [Naegleria gruberi]EFC47028.1 predicted protein [Naegleria gruberi]|eukprot:XP_002679772.1 predicted protein [Naegleria gruberi strain NEG-M]